MVNNELPQMTGSTCSQRPANEICRFHSDNEINRILFTRAHTLRFHQHDEDKHENDKTKMYHTELGGEIEWIPNILVIRR